MRWKDDVSRQSSYCGLFDHPVSKVDMDDIREATNKAWVLGNDRFKAKVELLMDRQVQAKPRVAIGNLSYLRKKVISIESNGMVRLTF